MTNIEKVIKKIIADVTDKEEIFLEDDLEKDLLIDSLSLINIFVEIENQLNIKIEEEFLIMSDKLTVKSLIDLSQKTKY